MDALFIGRFQPLHFGHLRVITNVSKDFDSVIIGIGSAQYSHTRNNPFTAGERYMMISKALEYEKIMNYKLVHIEDLHDYPKWVDHVISLVPRFDIVFTNDELCHELFKEKGYRTEKIELIDSEKYSGKEIRRRIACDESWEELVPKAVKIVIDNVDGVKRIKELYNGL